MANYLDELKKRIYSQQAEAPQTYRQKLDTFTQNANTIYPQLKRNGFIRAYNYLKTMTDLEDNGIDVKTVAPNYANIDTLMQNEDTIRKNYGDRAFEGYFSQAYNIANKAKDIERIGKAVKLKQTGYDADILNYLPDGKALSYADDEEDQLRKVLGKAPKAFDAKSIHSQAEKIRKAQAEESGEQYQDSDPYSSMFADSSISNEQLIDDLKTINRYYGLKSPQEMEEEQEAYNRSIRQPAEAAAEYNGADVNAKMAGGTVKAQQYTQPEQPAFLSQEEYDALIKQEEEKLKKLEIGNFPSFSTGNPTQSAAMGEINKATEPLKQAYAQQQAYLKQLKRDKVYMKDFDPNKIDKYLKKDTENETLRTNYIAEVEQLTGLNYDTAIAGLLDYNQYKIGHSFGETERPTDPKYEKLNEVIENTPGEAFIPTAKEMEENYKNGTDAFVHGIGTGLSFGLNELIHKGGEITPEKAKELAKNGVKLTFVLKRGDKYFIPSLEEQNEILSMNNPVSYMAGNMAGSIAGAVAIGGIAGAGAKAFGLGTAGARMAAGAAPAALRSGVQSAAQGDDPAAIAGKTIAGGLIGAGAQYASMGAEKAVGGMFNPGIARNVVGNTAGSVAYSAVDILGRAGITGVSGGKIDYNQELANLPADIVLDVILGGKIDIPAKAKADIIAKNVIDGKLDIDGVRADASARQTPTAPTGQPKGIPTVKAPTKATGASTVPPAPGTRTSKVAQSTYKYTGDEVLKKNLDGGVFDFIPKNDTTQYNTALKRVDEAGINNVINKYSNPVETIKGQSEARRYNDDDAAEMVAAIQKAYETGDTKAQQELLATAMDIGLTGGRMTNMWKMLKKLDSAGWTYYLNRQVKKLNAEGKNVYKGKWTDVSLTAAELDMLRSGKTQADFKAAEKAIYKRINQELPSTWTEKDAAWRRIAMLLNPTTHVRNFGGNTIMAGAIEVRDKLIGVMELARKKENRTKALVVKKETMGKAENHYKEANVADEMAGIKYEIGRIQTLKGDKRIFKNKALNALDTATKTTLKWEDDLFKRGRYIKSLSRYMDAKGLTEVTQAAHEFAMQDALESTFQDRSAVAKWLQGKKNAGKLGAAVDVMVPFVQTPVNITRRAIEYSPFGLGKAGYDFVDAHKTSAEIKKLNTKFNKGDLTDVEIKDLKAQRENLAEEVNTKIQKGIKDLAQGMAGTGVFVLGMMLASGKLIPGVSITGLAPNSEKEKEFLRDTGWQPLALKVGDTYISIDWATPIAPIIIAGAQTFHSTTEGNPEDAANIPLEAFTALADTITNSSVFTGIKRAIERKDAGELIIGIPSDYLGQHIPTVGGKLNAITESSEVSAYTNNPLENVKNRAIMAVPGLRQGLESAGLGDKLNLPKPTLDPWGKEKKTGDTWGRILDNMFNPAKDTVEQKNPVNTEIKRLYEAIKGTTNDTKVFPRTFDFKEVSAELTNKGKKTKYTFSINARELADMKAEVGQKTYNAILSRIQSPEYRNSGDKTKAKMLDEIYGRIFEAAKLKFVREKYNKVPPAPKIK
jgi:hypothetical protein